MGIKKNMFLEKDSFYIRAIKFQGYKNLLPKVSWKLDNRKLEKV